MSPTSGVGGPPPIDPGQVGPAPADVPHYEPTFGMQARFVHPEQPVELKKIFQRAKKDKRGGDKDRKLRNFLSGLVPESDSDDSHL